MIIPNQEGMFEHRFICVPLSYKFVLPTISNNQLYKFATEEPRCHQLSKDLNGNFRKKKRSNPNLNSAHFNECGCCNEENLQPYVGNERTQMSLINSKKTNQKFLEKWSQPTEILVTSINVTVMSKPTIEFLPTRCLSCNS